MPEARHRQHIITSGNIRIAIDLTQSFPAFWAHPRVGGPFPGLIVLHDDWGLGPHMRAVVHRFAEIGYYVIAPDLFETRLARNQVEADTLQHHYEAQAMPKVVAALTALETHRKCNAKMAVLGWDVGAEMAIQLALERPDIMAAVAFYGDAEPFLERLPALKCPLLSLLAGEDPITDRTLPRLREAIAYDQRHRIVVYPNAKHGFYNDSTPVYEPEFAEDAWSRVLNFLEIHQGKPPAPQEATNPGLFRPGRVY